MFAPVIKWTGSKRSQAEEIIKHFPQKIKCYYEPFLGSGAMMRAVMESGIKVDEFRCSDINGDLIRLWKDIHSQPDELATGYERLWLGLTGTDDDKTRKTAFYNDVRRRFNSGRSSVDFLFLLRTCANGMPRYNSRGEFNTSFHITRDGIRPDTMHTLLLEWHRLLDRHKVTFTECSYDTIQTQKGDFLYLDPPYAGTKGIYYGRIDEGLFFRWMERQKGHYALSFDGRCNEKDYTYDVPEHLYGQHTYVRSGNSSFRRVTGNSNNSIVYESLYIKNNKNMKNELIDKIDWDTYREHLAGSISNERLWSMGSFDSTAEMHEENIAKFEEELEMLENGEYQAIIDRHTEEMGEDVNEFFEDFIKSGEKIEKEHREDLFLDALTDIAMVAGWEHLEFEDSKQRSITLRSWAKEFTDLHAHTDWERTDYMTMVDEFAADKVKTWLNENRKDTERITDINIYSDKNGGLYIRCKIDGVQQMATRMTPTDTNRFNDRTDRIELVERYFKDALQTNQEKSKSYGR